MVSGETLRFPTFLLPQEELIYISDCAYQELSQVVTNDGISAGILASKDFRFHHNFGRDTAISADFINATYKDKHHDELWNNTRAAVFDFWDFQREDGKIRHEIRPYNRRRMRRANRFYYRLGDYMVNDDSVDATPLALTITPEFIQTKEEFIGFLPRVIKALDWMTQNMDQNNGWLSYKYNPHGLTHQGWMDSKFAVMHDNGDLPEDPIALVEVQSYAWKTMSLWADLLAEKIPDISMDLGIRAERLKKRFNEQFMIEDEKDIYFAHALDAKGNQIRNISINPGLVLWANYQGESIINKQYIPSVVSRLMNHKMFDEDAGIRTFETGQPVHDSEGYHNGNDIFWPFSTAMVAKGMLELGYIGEAEKIMAANLIPVKHFGSFIEQFRKNGSYSFFREGCKDGGCHNQTWTMAETLWIVNYLIAKQNQS